MSSRPREVDWRKTLIRLSAGSCCTRVPEGQLQRAVILRVWQRRGREADGVVASECLYVQADKGQGAEHCFHCFHLP